MRIRPKTTTGVLFLTFAALVCWQNLPAQEKKSVHFSLKKPQVNATLLSSPRNLGAEIVLTKVPSDLFLEGDPTGADTLRWKPDIACTLRYGAKPGSRNLSNYPNTFSAHGEGQLVFDPTAESVGPGVYYCILVSDEDETVTSVEFKIVVQANSVAITRSPLGTINVNDGPPLFRWDGVEGVPYYFVFLSEGPLTIDRNEAGEVKGVTGLKLTWQLLTPETFVNYGDLDPTGNFSNQAIPPLLPGIKYNWLVLNAYGPTTDLLTSDVAPVAPSFFEVNRTTLAQSPALLSPANNQSVDGDEIEFQWSPVSGASRYHLFLYQQIEYEGNEIEFTMWKQVTSETQLTVKTGKLLISGNYSWRVIADSPSGSISASNKQGFVFEGRSGQVKFVISSEEGLLPRVNIDIRNEVDGATLLPAITDSLGKIVVPLPEGQFSYVATREGFLSTPRTTFSVQNNDTNTVNIKMSRGLSTVTGQCIDLSRAPIFDARVALTSGSRTEITRTDESGYFLYTVLPGTWTLRVSKREFVDLAPSNITVQPEEAVDLGQIQLEPANNSISGQVTFAADGRPLSGAIARIEQGDTFFESTTSAQGGFRFVVGPGAWRVTVNSGGLYASPPEYIVELGQNDQRNASFQLSEGGLVYGNISFGGVGVEEATITAFEESSGKLLQKAVTNIHGNYSLGLPAGDFELRVSSRNFLEIRRNISITTGQTVVEDFHLAEAGFLQGKVLNSESTTPLQGAIVFVVSDTTIRTTTDINGAYFLGLPPDALFEIDAKFPGFGSNGPFSVITSSGQTSSQDFLLKPLSGVIRGLVSDGFFPIPDALVRFEELELELTTDSDGRFEVEVVPDTHTVSASKECHFTNRDSVILIAGQTRDIHIRLQALRSVITGTVADAAGQAIAGAQITAESDTSFTAFTASDGRYELCLNSGIFRITVSRAGYVAANRTLVISEGDSLGGINFTLEDNFARLRGTVRNQAGVPVPLAFVSVSNDQQTRRDTTDASGAFLIDRIIPKIASTVEVTKIGLFAEPLNFFFLGRQDLDLNLTLYPADGTIAGTIRDLQTGAGIDEVVVSAQLESNSKILFSTRSDASGRYSIDQLPVIPDRTYSVFAFKEGFFSPGAVEDVPPNTAGVDLALVNRSGHILGRVRDADTGEVIDNARLEATSAGGTRSIAFSDSAGFFDLTALVPTETYTLSAQRSGFLTKRIFDLKPGNDQKVVEMTRRYGFVTGVIRNSHAGQTLGDVPVEAMPNGGGGRHTAVRTDNGGQFLLRVIADNYSIRPARSHHRSEPALIQLDIAEADTITGVDFTLEHQTVQSISIQRADLSQKPSISNREVHCYIANARDLSGRPVNIGAPEWSLNVSRQAATIDQDGCIDFNPEYFGDLTITAGDPMSSIEGQLTVQVFASIDSATAAILFDDRGLQLIVPRRSVLSRKDLFVSKQPIAPAKRGRAEIFTTDSSFVLKPPGLSFDNPVRLMLDAPPNNAVQSISIGRWDDVTSTWVEERATRNEFGLFEISITETGEYVAIAEAKELAIENLSLLPNPFSPVQQILGQPGGLKIAFDLSSQAAPNPLLTLKIYNLQGNLVRLLHDQTPFIRGQTVVYWDGKTDAGLMARNGRYLVHLTLEDPTGSREQMKTVVLIK